MNVLGELANVFLGIFESNRLFCEARVPIESISIEEAYAVQRQVIERRVANGERIAGYKVGCTSQAIRKQFGLTEPICGRVMEPHVLHGDTQLNWVDFHRPAVEPEFVVVMGKDVADEVDDESLIGSIDYVSPGVEVHNYRFWFGKPTSQELIASNGIHACLAVGNAKIKASEFDWDMEGIGLFKNGRLAASGIGADVMGRPMKSLRWLVNHLVHQGECLRAGQLVIPGSPVELILVEAGDEVTARFNHVDEVGVEFSAVTS